MSTPNRAEQLKELKANPEQWLDAMLELQQQHIEVCDLANGQIKANEQLVSMLKDLQGQNEHLTKLLMEARGYLQHYRVFTVH